jgi:hypothetical protein
MPHPYLEGGTAPATGAGSEKVPIICAGVRLSHKLVPVV